MFHFFIGFEGYENDKKPIGTESIELAEGEHQPLNSDVSIYVCLSFCLCLSICVGVCVGVCVCVCVCVGGG